MLLEADWVLPITGPAIAGGAVLVREGRIEAVGPAAQLRARLGDLAASSEPVRSFPGCVLMPGLVNVHSHLEYSAFHGFSLSCGFGEWMLRLLLSRRKLGPADFEVSAAWGARECARCGTTTLADTSFEGWTSLRAAAAAGLRGRIYLEVIGLDDGAIPSVMSRTEARLAALEADRTPFLDIGLSPHAPYTVSQRLYRELARFARRNQLWLATHVAESQAEVELLLRGTGSIARAYKAAQLWKGRHWKAPGLRPADYVASAGALGSCTLAVHCVHLDEGEIGTIAASGAAVAHCPRSNARLQCGNAPAAELRAAGVPVGLGTDSLASNDSLDLFAEMRAALTAARERDPANCLTPSDVLRMATIDGATAIGLGESVGSLQAGKRADLVAVRLAADVARSVGSQRPAGPAVPGPAAFQAGPDSRSDDEPTRQLTDALVATARASDVVATLVDGRVVFEAGQTESGSAAAPPADGLSLAFDAVRARLGLAPCLPER